MSLEQIALEPLCATCQQQLQRFRLYREPDTSSCDEILRQATAHSEPAISCLCEVTFPLIRPRCPPVIRRVADDWAQDVLLLVMQKMRNRESPYRVNPPPPRPFVAYRSFVDVVGRRVAYNYAERERGMPQSSIDQIQAEGSSEPPDPRSDLAELYKRLRFERLLVLIPKPLDREIFRLRFAQDLGTDETVAALGRQGVVTSKRDVQRSVERTIRYLSTLPEVRGLFEDDDGNDG